MPNMKLRGFGQYGVVTDIDAFDLPLQAFSRGVNIRFVGAHVERAPIFRTCKTLAADSPRTIFSRSSPTGTDDVFVGYLDGSVSAITPSTETDKSIASYTPADADVAFTNTTLARVLYINREDRAPWAYLPEATQFTALTNWDSSWRCKILRSYNASLIALNMTKGGIEYPTMVNTSDFPTDGIEPSSWDYTVPGTNCYQNIISELRSEIVDGLPLNNSFFIYGLYQVFEMQATGDSELYKVEPRFLDRGCLATNCVAEVDGLHYVFGLTDIYKHDGLTPQSLIDDKVRRFIFSGLNRSKAQFAFVRYDPNLKEVLFCYPSLDPYCAFPDTASGAGCNRAAVYSLTNGTWTFYDLPYVLASTLASFPQSLTWDQLSGTAWDQFGGSWNDLADTVRRGTLTVGVANSALALSAKAYGHDLYEGGVFSYDVDAAATPPAYLEREGVDLDEVPPYFLGGNKLVRSIVPQARLSVDAEPLEFSFGTASGSNDLFTYDDYQSFDGTADTYKLDFNQAGRYLAFRMRHEGFRSFTFLGFDLDVKKLSDR